jgi:hypothetical protein
MKQNLPMHWKENGSIGPFPSAGTLLGIFIQFQLLSEIILIL